VSGRTANTTALIANWTMSGAQDDLGDRFESVVDIDALVAELERASETKPTAQAPLLLKPAGEDEWHTLASAAEHA
jgi:hypothetical protein